MPALHLRRASVTRIGIAVAASVVLTACGALTPPNPVTEQARQVDDLYSLIFAIAIAIFFVVEGLIVWSVIRYRRRDERLPSQFHGNTTLEIVWTAIPTLIVIVIFVLSLGALDAVEERTERPGATILVQGFQWQWNFTYLQGDDDSADDPRSEGTAAEPAILGLPINEPVRLILDSTDVIHAFYVPQFLIKRDVNPYPAGVEENTLEFTVQEAGEYTGQCAEFCGEGHNAMRFVVLAMPRAEYDSWVAALVAGGEGGATASPEPTENGESSPEPTAESEPTDDAEPTEEPEATAEPEVTAEPESTEAAATAIATAELDETRISLTVADGQFSEEALEVPAGRPFTLTLQNDDPGVQHNVSIYREGLRIFLGEFFAGVDSRDYAVPALDPGTYAFVCEVHPADEVGPLAVTE